MKSRGNAASALVLLMLLFFVLWVLFLPPSARDELLGSNTSQLTYTPQFNKTLLSQAVGSLIPEGPPIIEHPLPSIFLFESKTSQVVVSQPAFSVQNSLFDALEKTVSFSLTNQQDLLQLSLVFRAPLRKGLLSILLNGVEIFSDTVQSESVAPLVLSKGLLKDQNTLTFKVSSAGIWFWRTNQYRIENLQVIADLQDRNRQQASMSFGIDNTELNNLQSSSLSFIPDCDQKTAGTLSILLNNKKIHEAIPDCGSINKQDLLGADLQVGKNELLLSLSKGSVRVEQAKIQSRIKPTRSFLAFFQISDVLLQEVQSRIAHVVLDVRFVDDGKQKSGITNVNGRLDSFDQQNPVFSRDISAIIRPGNNYIELVPRTPLHVVSVDVRVE